MNYFITIAIILFLYMSSWFLLSVLKKRNDLADIAWGLGFFLLSWISFFLGQIQGLRGLLACLLVTIWGLRLAWHIHSRNKNKSEDYRYAKWREDWGQWFYLRSYLQVYMLQGVFLFLIVFPVLLINKSLDTSLNFLDIVALVVWLIGFIFESVGDYQLKRFIKNPNNRGQLMQSGLWRYTRHPNYFGEVVQWWGIWLLALSVTNGLFSIIGPITITILILKVSGIPLLEEKMREKPQFAEYARRTSIFIPWFVNEKI